MLIFYSNNNDFIYRDISLTGGTTITLYSDEVINIEELESFLQDNIESFSIREITGLTTGRQEAIIIESPVESGELKTVLEDT